MCPPKYPIEVRTPGRARHRATGSLSGHSPANRTLEHNVARPWHNTGHLSARPHSSRCAFSNGTGKLERQSARHASILRSRTMWFLRKKSDDQRRSVFVLTTGSPCRSPSVGDPRLAISVSISDVISDSLTNRSDSSSRRNLHPSRCPPAPNSNSYARIRLRSNGRLMRVWCPPDF